MTQCSRRFRTGELRRQTEILVANALAHTTTDTMRSTDVGARRKRLTSIQGSQMATPLECPKQWQHERPELFHKRLYTHLKSVFDFTRPLRVA